jgi:hypothetical protein
MRRHASPRLQPHPLLLPHLAPPLPPITTFGSRQALPRRPHLPSPNINTMLWHLRLLPQPPPLLSSTTLALPPPHCKSTSRHPQTTLSLSENKLHPGTQTQLLVVPSSPDPAAHSPHLLGTWFPTTLILSHGPLCCFFMGQVVMGHTFQRQRDLSRLRVFVWWKPERVDDGLAPGPDST